MSRIAIILTLVAAACGSAGTASPHTAEVPSTPSSSSTTTTVTTTTVPIPPSQTDPEAERQSGIQFTDLLTLDRIGRGDGAPVVILVHGGGWYGGDRSSTEPLGQLLADEGFVVINATYRTGSGGFPESVEDVVCATIAGRAIATEAGGTGPVVLVGHSAGAHISALVALAGDLFTPRDCAFEGDWEPLDGFVGLAGPYKIQNLFGLLNDWMGVSRDQDPDLWDKALPENYVDRQLDMPVRLIHGDADNVSNLSFSELFSQELGAVDGRDVELVVIPGAGHSSMLAPLMDADVTLRVIDALTDSAAATEG